MGTNKQAKRIVKTTQGWEIHFPLQEPRGFKRPRFARIVTVKKEIGLLLSLGYHTKCPLTGKPIRLYRRGLHRSQVRTLERLRDKSDKLGKTYLHLEFFSGRRDGDLAKLEAWGLAQRLRNIDKLEGEKSSGQWRITEKGRAWLAGAITVPRQQAFLLGKHLGPVDERDLIGPDEVAGDFDAKRLLDGDDGLAPALMHA